MPDAIEHIVDGGEDAPERAPVVWSQDAQKSEAEKNLIASNGKFLSSEYLELSINVATNTALEQRPIEASLHYRFFASPYGTWEVVILP